MLLKVLQFVGLNFVISLFIVTISFISIIVKFDLTKKSQRVFLTIFTLLCEIFIMVLCFKLFSFWALLLPSLMLVFTFVWLLFYNADDDYKHEPEDD